MTVHDISLLSAFPPFSPCVILFVLVQNILFVIVKQALSDCVTQSKCFYFPQCVTLMIKMKDVYQGVCPRQAVTSTGGKAKRSERHAVGAGLKLVTLLMLSNLSRFVLKRTVGTIKGIPETLKIVPWTLL